MKRNVKFFVWIFSLLLAFGLGVRTANATPLGGYERAPVSPVGKTLRHNRTRDVIRDQRRGVDLLEGQTPDSGEADADWQTVPVPPANFWRSQPPRYRIMPEEG